MLLPGRSFGILELDFRWPALDTRLGRTGPGRLADGYRTGSTLTIARTTNPRHKSKIENRKSKILNALIIGRRIAEPGRTDGFLTAPDGSPDGLISKKPR